MTANPRRTLDRAMAAALAAGRQVREYGPNAHGPRPTMTLDLISARDYICIVFEQSDSGYWTFNRAYWYDAKNDRTCHRRINTLRQALALVDPTGTPAPALADLLASGTITIETGALHNMNRYTPDSHIPYSPAAYAAATAQ